MPQLYHCNLSLNPLSSFEDPSESFAECVSSPDYPSSTCLLTKMNSLVLNCTNISWSRVFWLMEAMPKYISNLALRATRLLLIKAPMHFCSLEELHLSLNDMQILRVPVGAPVISSLRVLHMNECNIDSWDLLESIIICFPALETLVAANNPIKNLLLSENQVSRL